MQENISIINFWKTGDEYGEFSNFWYSPIYILGVKYKTVEHYFQSQKFLDSNISQSIIDCNSPHEAVSKGRNRNLPLRKDWENVKIDIMRLGVTAKFDQHPKLKDLLISTGNSILIENSPYDYFWGIGENKTGKNILGKILMELRSKYISEIPKPH
jgi:ribA/ribD-fused uncharacterized protein